MGLIVDGNGGFGYVLFVLNGWVMLVLMVNVCSGLVGIGKNNFGFW